MFTSYLKIFIRSFANSRLIAGINMLSLAVGLAGVIAIFFYVRHELQVDASHPEGERVFRLTYDETTKIPNGRYLATTSPPMGPTLEREYPEVEQAIRLRYTDDVMLEREEKQFYEKELVYADPGFFKLFDFSLAKGDAGTALEAPNSIVITPAMVDRYFGPEDPIGKNLLLEGETSLTVTGVLAENPSQSHLKFDALLSFSTFKVPYGYPVNLESWGWISFHTYLLLRQAEDAPLLSSKLDNFMTRHLTEGRAARAELRLQPLSDIYFHSGNMLNGQHNAQGNLLYVYGLSAVALLLILVAGFNYMNIATARSIRKGKEVGLRKILGARPQSIIWQFLTESVVLAVLSLLVGLLLFQVFAPFLLETLGLEETPVWSDYLKISPLLLGLAVVIGLLAGFYPAYLQSRFASIDAIKGKLKAGRSSLRIRKILIVSQFVVTSILISGTLLVQQQMHYVQQKALGFAKEEVLALQMQTPDFLERYPQAKQRLTQNAYVRQVSAGDLLNGDYGSVPIVPDGFSREETSAMHLLGGYFDYFSTLGVNLVAGRDFSSDHPTDTSGIILNQMAAKAFGWTAAEAIGKQIEVNESQNGQVIGVTEDFHFKSLHDPIQPLVTVVPRTRMEYFLLRIETADIPAAIASIQADWEAIAPELPFNFSFVNEAVEQRYQADERFLKLIGIFSTLAILLACMGLYGLIATMVEYRVREIGVRKVLGASIWQISTLLARQFLLLLVLANVLAIPIAIWAGREWLNGFTYHTPIGWPVFMASAVLIIILALISIGHQTLKAAMGNPVQALKDQ